jgi:hypothetical protein
VTADSCKSADVERDEPLELPRTLPANPANWTRSCVMHLNFGRKGAAASFEIRDERGVRMPFSFGYHTGNGTRGFYLPHSDDCLTWDELRKRWPAWIKARARITASGKSPDKVMKHVTKEHPLEMFVIYDRPKDAPGGFFVRSWQVLPGIIAPGKALGWDLPSLEDARALVPQGLVNIGRTPDDDAKIVEVWV